MMQQRSTEQRTTVARRRQGRQSVSNIVRVQSPSPHLPSLPLLSPFFRSKPP